MDTALTPSPRRPAGPARAAVAVLLTAGLAGCTTSTPATPSTSGPRTAAPTTPSPTGSPAPRVDWERPVTTALSESFSLGPCDGDAPLVCVRSASAVVGTIEVLRFPLASLPALAGRTGDEALRAHASAYVSSFVEDRRQGCPPGYVVTPSAVRLVAPGVVAYGFTGTLASGAASERQLQYAGIRGSDLVVLSAPAYEDDGCLPPEGDVFDVATLDALEPLLDAVVAVSPLP